jgi:hypothetical protein
LSAGQVPANMLRVADIDAAILHELLGRYGIELVRVADDAPIHASFWGEPEAGIVGTRVIVRGDTPIHSLLHEACHIICMTGERRKLLVRDAGGDDLEESAVCYLQVLLADELRGVGRRRLMHDMDAWGYSFRLGDTASWFREDAADAIAWLRQNRLLDEAGIPLFHLRGA